MDIEFVACHSSPRLPSFSVRRHGHGLGGADGGFAVSGVKRLCLLDCPVGPSPARSKE